jgi:hypothetical protein
MKQYICKYTYIFYYVLEFVNILNDYKIVALTEN